MAAGSVSTAGQVQAKAPYPSPTAVTAVEKTFDIRLEGLFRPFPAFTPIIICTVERCTRRYRTVTIT